MFTNSDRPYITPLRLSGDTLVDGDADHYDWGFIHSVGDRLHFHFKFKIDSTTWSSGHNLNIKFPGNNLGKFIKHQPSFITGFNNGWGIVHIKHTSSSQVEQWGSLRRASSDCQLQYWHFKDTTADIVEIEGWSY